MSRLPQVALQPVARPVDTFAAPEVRKSSPPVLFAELAGALSKITPELQQVVDRRGQAFAEGSQIRAKADALKNQYENMAALKQAVDSGKITEQDNPWYLVQLKQEVARHEAETAAAQARVAYYNDNSGVRFADDPQVVEKFLNERFAPLVQGRDAWEMEALAPALQQAGHALVNEHIRNRQDQREQEREVSFQNTVASMLNTLDPDTLDSAQNGDALAVDKVQQVQSAVQNLVDRSAMTVRGVKLNKWLVEAALNSGITRRDERIYQQVLSTVKDPSGNTVGDTAEAKSLMSVADEKIQNERRRTVREVHEDQQLQDEQDFRVALGTVQKAVDAAPKDSNLLDLPLNFKDLPPTVRARLEVHLLQQQNNRRNVKNIEQEDTANYITGELTKGLLNGTLREDTKISLLSFLAAMGKMPDVLSLASLEDRRRNDNWGPTSPETEVALMEKHRSATLSPSDVISAIKDGQLDKSDGRYWMQSALAVQAGNGRGAMADENYDKTLQSLIFSKYKDESGLEDVSKLHDDATLSDRLLAARIGFQKDSLDWLRTHPNATLLERDEAMRKLLDSTAKQYGGYQYQEWQEKVKKSLEAPSPKPVKTKSGEKVPDPVLGASASIDPTVSKLTGDDIVELKRIRDIHPTEFSSSLEYPKGYQPLIPTGEYADFGFNKATGKPFRGFDPLASSTPTDTLGRYLAIKQIVATPKSLEKNSPQINEAYQSRLEGEWNKAMLQKQLLRNVINHQDVVGKLKSALDETRISGTVSNELKTRVDRYDNILREYSMLSVHAGYSVEEVKTFAPGSWLKVPMFANLPDLNKRGQSVSEQLGLTTPQEVGSFIAAQRTLLNGTTK